MEKYLKKFFSDANYISEINESNYHGHVAVYRGFGRIEIRQWGKEYGREIEIKNTLPNGSLTSVNSMFEQMKKDGLNNLVVRHGR